MRSLISVCTAAAALITAAPAMAAAETVRVADLDLLWEGDLAELDRRIQRAARRHCEASAVRPEALSACEAETTARLQPQRSALIAQARRGERSRSRTLTVG